jgi:plasmid stabilization system protein ParE
LTRSRYVLSEQAVQDILEIVDYIEPQNTDAAERFEKDLHAALGVLVAFPGVGRQRSDLTDLPVRFWPLHKRYLIVYRPTTPLEIIRVLSGYRDIAALLDS